MVDAVSVPFCDRDPGDDRHGSGACEDGQEASDRPHGLCPPPAPRRNCVLHPGPLSALDPTASSLGGPPAIRKMHSLAPPRVEEALPGLAAPEGRGYRRDVERTYDAVIVGSGFGGGITACRLAEAGWRVCVLERGRRFGRGDFPDRPEQAPRAFWHPKLNPGGLFELRLMKDLSVQTAAGVGGGSLVYANVQLRAPSEVFSEGWPEAITRQALDPYYERTEEALQPRPVPEEPPLPRVGSFAALGKRAGREPKRLPLAVHFGEDRQNPFSGVAQQGCTNLARCDLGCPRHAKNTIDITYLARAENHGAEVFPLQEAQRLDPPLTSNGNWRVGFRDLQYRDRGVVEAPVVVLAAGSLGSSRLLLENRGRLPALSPALGTRFSGNGDALGLIFDPGADDVAGARIDYGPVMTGALDYTAEHRFMLADGGLPANFSGLLEIIRGLNALSGWRRWLLRLKGLAARLGAGDQLVGPRQVRLAEHSPITDSLVFLMIGRDAANGRMRLTPLFRRFDIDWSREESRELFEAMRQKAGELAALAEATPFFALDAGPLGKFITVHPLGGCPMADDPGQGVVDDRGAVRGYDGLYVSDGSIVPTALGVNPSKTIAALAERGVEQLLVVRGQ
jgi:cholesterol oxidase